MSRTTSQRGEHGWGGAIPVQLRERTQWVVTEDKKPLIPSSGWNDPDCQLSFDQAVEYARQRDAELAFALRPEDPFVVIDFDHVGPPDSHPDIVENWIHTLDTYTEVSRSRTGLHLICKGTRLPDRQEKGDLDCQGSVDMFDAGQYVVLTGDAIGSTPTITEGGVELYDFQREYLPERGETSTDDGQSRDNRGAFTRKHKSETTIDCRPVDIRRTIREYAVDGSEHAQRTRRLWQSPTSSDAGYSTPSEADLALCSDLAFWCQEDARLMDRCFRESNRYRAKWDEVHYADGRTYGEGTIQTAVQSNYSTYSANRYVVWE